ncbi:hypothetical protein [Nocardia sp. NPDC005978]|uniref:hypothetical protein n=1 Tax=unclassified Nocardia TaxID=2637762 RepID=UPI0033A74D1B
MADYWRPPVRRSDVVVAVVIYAVAVGFGLVAVALVPEYEVLARETGETRYLPYAYAVGWAGIVITLLVVPLWVLRAVRLRQPAWRTALLAFPLMAEALLLGLLAAVVAVSL